MLKWTVVKTLAVALLAVPAVSQAAFDQFYSGSAGSPAGPAGVLVNASTNTTIDLFFDTNSIHLGGVSGGTGVIAWAFDLAADGDIKLNNGVSGGDVDGLSTCLSVNGVQSICSAIDGGAFVFSGVEGIGIAMLSIDIIGSTIGAELVATSADFSNEDFSNVHPAPRVLATIVPEPSTALLLGMGLAGLAAMRRRAA